MQEMHEMETSFQPGRVAPPERPAVVMTGSGAVVTYGALEDRSRRLARLLAARGLAPGDHIAVLLENQARYLEVCWAAQRSGLFFTPINWHLTPAEAAYIAGDCGARALVTSPSLLDLARRATAQAPLVTIRLLIGDSAEGWQCYEEAIAAHPPEPLRPELEGDWMFYSSGTTGRPKGIVHPLRRRPFGTPSGLDQLLRSLYGMGSDTVYLCPAPLYHAAPLGWSMGVQRWGGTVVVMESFDAAAALAAIARHRVTHAQFVPTMFVRMLKLPEAQRAASDHSSLRVVVHAAAPCPVDVKHRMLAWWGPVVYEYYAGSEGNGFVAIGPEEWLAHPGSVGRPQDTAVHILGPAGEQLPPGEPGTIWFEGQGTFAYHNDPVKTAEAFNTKGWSTLGDIGYLDEEGYLFLTDRVAHTIISGGVNIYPQEVEDVLVVHPAVLDVAVIGVPHEEFGEEVKAVVQVAPGVTATAELASELIAYCRERIAAFKCPRSVDFTDALPRLPSGKLRKALLRERYWAGRSSRI